MLTIKEFAATKRVSHQSDFTVLGDSDFLLLHIQTYDSEAIQLAISDGKEALITRLRNDDFFPVRPCAEVIADTVMDLFGNLEESFVEIFFDDRESIVYDNVLQPE